MVDPLPAELERRIEMLERTHGTPDLDARGWGWVILFGALVPALLLALGWWF
jgi:hypothetical protein